ncbi:MULTISPECIES: LacI family DNA-binding transcriptional regulator [unclassified Pseudomonas]|uniref:LacI family DNA-binding transcriptional regulator n=1 Tax=unclassified Pseudomonas TaxID=196821 RepID=UPI0015A0FAE8|nr:MULTISPECIES: LacI family DNA-binding transcriptional regulator [unclassified Pseudomonas]NVZ50364.1 LacI family DNA-binding transcriptional regulator [Pseudomonas sp. B6002]NWE21157.1 LacI family DNA-binding transcriptional regulator [Pseudomonas sp. P7548]
MTDLKDVARLAGVSRATAARTFASPDQVRPTTREQVFAAARELGFRPNLLGRQLRLQTTQLIGVVVPNLLNPVFAEQFQAMERAARLRGYSLLLATTDYNSERESIVVEELLRQRVDGLVLTVTDAESNAVLSSLNTEQTPFVLAYHQPSNPNYSAVSVDNRAGMALATRYLLEAGHRRISMVAGPALQSDRARLRYAGYCDAMNEYGLDSRPVIEMPAHTQAEFAAIEPFLQGPDAPTALVCSNDFLAISLIAELRRNRWNVPEQLSVMGFDGISLGTQMHPTLCSVVQPIALLASTVIDQLLAQIAGNDPISHCLPCHIRPGDSTQPHEETPDARVQ